MKLIIILLLSKILLLHCEARALDDEWHSVEQSERVVTPEQQQQWVGPEEHLGAMPEKAVQLGAIPTGATQPDSSLNGLTLPTAVDMNAEQQPRSTLEQLYPTDGTEQFPEEQLRQRRFTVDNSQESEEEINRGSLSNNSDYGKYDQLQQSDVQSSWQPLPLQRFPTMPDVNAELPPMKHDEELQATEDQFHQLRSTIETHGDIPSNVGYS